MIPAYIHCKACDRDTDFIWCHSYETELICPECFEMVKKAADVWARNWRTATAGRMLEAMFPGYVH